MRPRIMLVVLGLVLVACGGEVRVDAGPQAGDPNGTDAAAPAEPPPTVDGPVEAPPPAWIEVDSARWWMAYGSFCWDNGCVDMISPSQLPGVPTLEVARGDTVRFHLGFDPSEVRVSFADEDGRRTSLPPGRDLEWEVARGGFVVLTAWRAQGGDASYVVELSVPDAEQTASSPGARSQSPEEAVEEGCRSDTHLVVSGGLERGATGEPSPEAAVMAWMEDFIPALVDAHFEVERPTADQATVVFYAETEEKIATVDAVTTDAGGWAAIGMEGCGSLQPRR